MKLGIFCNFSHEHVGGSEMVLKNISELLVKNHNYEVCVYSFSCKVSFYHEGVKYVPCKKGNDLISQINENNHTMVYSDSFWGWDTIVENIKRIDCDVSCCLVGAYHMREHNKATGEKFKTNIDKFRAICHSRGRDYEWCVKNDIPHTIIPNGVDLDEFNDNNIDFRDKYGIEEEYIILNVSNFFYGKGQELLAKIYKELEANWLNFRIISISNTVAYSYDKSFLARTKQAFENSDRVTFLRDLPREDVVAAFKCSDVFVFPSLKEVAPLVIIESIAANLPWVSFDVGNVAKYRGGFVVAKRHSFNKGYIIPDHIDVSSFSSKIGRILRGTSGATGQSIQKDLKRQMSRGMEALDWKQIVPEYDRVFSR